MRTNGFFEFLTYFVDLTDPRKDRGRNHCLVEMVALALCGTICGADSWADIERFSKAHPGWFRQFLELKNGVPSHDTFGRVFRRLDTDEFLRCITTWIREWNFELEKSCVAIDGKTLRGSHDVAVDQKPLHVVSAWANKVKVCLGQVSVDHKSNEIPAVRELLDLLELEGAVVTMDAMHCQKKTLRMIRARGADYLVQVKDNQPKLHARLRDEFDRLGETNFTAKRLRQHSKTERNRGRRETRTCMVYPAPADVKQLWPDVQTIGIMHRARELKDGTESSESTVFISSLAPKVREHVKYLREHWSIENELHHTLDVTFTEDASRIRKDNGPEISSAFRRLSLSILKQDTTINDNVRGKRLTAGWDLDKLQGMITAFQAA